MNWFVIVIGIEYIGAAIYSFMRGNPLWAVIYLAYGISCFALSVLEGRK